MQSISSIAFILVVYLNAAKARIGITHSERRTERTTTRTKDLSDMVEDISSSEELRKRVTDFVAQYMNK